MKAAEDLCKQTLRNSRAGHTGPSSTIHVNPDAVQKCVGDVINLARSLTNDESRYSKAVSCIVEWCEDCYVRACRTSHWHCAMQSKSSHFIMECFTGSYIGSGLLLL